jgi:hypothetical protein
LTGTASVAAPFSILSGASYNLAAGASQTVTVQFSPTVAGSYAQTLTLTGAGGTNVAVTGIATNVPTPVIQITAASLSLGTILTNSTAASSFTVENSGTGILMGTASIAAPFSILAGANYSLAAGASQTVVVEFSPTVAGSYAQALSLTGAGGTNVAVTGIATNTPPTTPVLQVTPGSLSFGSLISGNSETNSITVMNAGGGTLTGTVTVPLPFSIISGQSYSLGANESQTVAIAFSPIVSGTYTRTINLTGNVETNLLVSGIGTNVAGVPPTVSAIRSSVASLSSNPYMLVVAPNTSVQLSAKVTVTNNDPVVWQWLVSTNGAPPVILQTGTGTSPATRYTSDITASGCTFVWTLQATDSQNGLSAEAQLTNFIQLLPPPGIRIHGN